MRLVRLRHGRRRTWGLVWPDGAVWDGGARAGHDARWVAGQLLGAGGGKALLAALGLSPDRAPAADYRWEELEQATSGGSGPQLLLPWRPPEVWAAGVTYRSSELARTEESREPDIYRRVYAAPRPELFFKATGDRVVGPGEPVGLRPDSAWQVPEPELAVVTDGRGGVVGVLAGNDMTCRDLEGENPLYLPQAKIYDGACALGPALLLADDGARARRLSLRVVRDGRPVLEMATTTGELRRSPEELLRWLGRAYRVRPGTVLLTGTGLVPPGSFSLAPGDQVEVDLEGVGRLINPCRPLAPPPEP